MEDDFEPILESFEEELKILEIEKNPYYQLQEQVEKPIKDCKVKVAPTNEQNVEDDFSYKHKLEEMNILNWRLGIYFQELFKIENGLHTFEDDSTYTGMKNIVPEEQDVLAILVKGGLHFDYIQIKINNVLGFIERLRNQMETVQSKVHFESKEIEIRECPKEADRSKLRFLNRCTGRQTK